MEDVAIQKYWKRYENGKAESNKIQKIKM